MTLMSSRLALPCLCLNCCRWVSPQIDLPLLVASFGASAVLLFGVPEGKMSQPRNLFGERCPLFPLL